MVTVHQIGRDLETTIRQFGLVVIDKQWIFSTVNIKHGNRQTVTEFLFRVFIQLKGRGKIHAMIVGKPVIILLSIDGYLLSIETVKTCGGGEGGALLGRLRPHIHAAAVASADSSMQPHTTPT